MFCNKCGKEIPDDSKFCPGCGVVIPEPAPRHARPEPEEIYSYSDRQHPDEPKIDPYTVPDDRTKIYDGDAGERMRQYDFEMFEEHDPAPSVPRMSRYKEPQPEFDDSYENYLDGEDDDTFMDKIDNRFRRDDDRPRRGKGWIWAIVAIVAVTLIAAIILLIVSGALSKGAKKSSVTVKPSAAATVSATLPPAATQAQQEVPETLAPATQAPAVTEAPTVTPTAPEVTPTEPEPYVPQEDPQPVPDDEPSYDDQGDPVIDAGEFDEE